MKGRCTRRPSNSFGRPCYPPQEGAEDSILGELKQNSNGSPVSHLNNTDIEKMADPPCTRDSSLSGGGGNLRKSGSVIHGERRGAGRPIGRAQNSRPLDSAPSRTRVSTQTFEGAKHQAAECPFEDSCLAVFRLTASHVETNIVLHGQAGVRAKRVVTCLATPTRAGLPLPPRPPPPPRQQQRPRHRGRARGEQGAQTAVAKWRH
ncbi:expressed unknown protein [Ectocarpus siliculosus]|uniref:Uncharacterized protein n=1 Tax=Ectocarpus siliculosus TaxID=2880 RepID=D7FRF9_ECTSI|nr:expressed unknown protein [Ectocarpus siliculosus]|eukprot:CBJ30750.1 expressed unknown protein [Ectocarpus siliculosus]